MFVLQVEHTLVRQLAGCRCLQCCRRKFVSNVLGNGLRVGEAVEPLCPSLGQHSMSFTGSQLGLRYRNSFSCKAEALAIERRALTDSIDLSLQLLVQQAEFALQRRNARGELRRAPGRILTPGDAHQYLVPTNSISIPDRQPLYAPCARCPHFQQAVDRNQHADGSYAIRYLDRYHSQGQKCDRGSRHADSCRCRRRRQELYRPEPSPSQ